MDRRDRPLLAAWAILLGLTLLSFESSWGSGRLASPGLAVAAAIGIAMIKVRIVILHFMEVRHAPWALRGPIEAWLLALAAGILGLWYSAGA
jgi:cytochrome c oxidase subunit IV